MTYNPTRARYDPYCRTWDELKTTPRRIRKKQTTNPKNQLSDKYLHGKSKKRTSPQSSNPAKIGKYILSDINSSNCMCKAVHVDTQKEFTCRVVEIGKYRDIVAPYYLTHSHENINKIEEIIVGDQFAYILFEKSYGDLHSYIRSKRKLKEDEASRLFKQIVSVVSYCHDVGLVLRDLKLRKFVFKDKARTQLKLQTLDDAYAIKDNSDILYDKHGCPAYVSPEILESTTGYSSKRADIWSLGVMVYTMLCGRYPFHEQDPSALFTKIKHGYFEINEPITSKGKCLIHSILRKNPCERLTAEELLEHPWFNSNFETMVSGRLDRKRYDQLVPDISSTEPTFCR